MLNKKSTPTIIVCLAVPVFLAILPAFGIAGVSLDYSLGFDGVFSLNNWTPITIVLENPGAGLNGTLEVVTMSGSELRGDIYSTVYAMEAPLPGHSRKRYQFNVFIDTFTHPLVIRYREKNREVVAGSLNLRPYYTTQKLLLLVGGRTYAGPSVLRPDEIKPVGPGGRDLPEKWYGYLGVEMVVVSASVLDDLGDGQYGALVDWVEQGGFLVVSPDDVYGPLMGERIRDFLKIRTIGFSRRKRLASLEAFCGAELVSSGPMALVEARIDGGRVLADEDGIPIVTYKKIGRGGAVLLGIDGWGASLADWSGRNLFWNKLYDLRPNKEPVEFDLPEKKIISNMAPGAFVGRPTFYVVAGFFILYAGLAAILLRNLGIGRKKRILGPLSVLGVGMVFTILGYWYFFHNMSLNYLTHNCFSYVKFTGDNRRGTGRRYIGLFSKTKNRGRLDLNSEPYPVYPLPREKGSSGEREECIFRENDDGRTLFLDLYRWSSRFVRVDYGPETEVQGKAVSVGGQVTIGVNNQGAAIRNAFYYFSGRVFLLGDLPSMVEFSRTTALEGASNGYEFDRRDMGRLVDAIIEEEPEGLERGLIEGMTSDLLLSLHSGYNTDRSVIHLIGWLDCGAVPAFGEVNGTPCRGMCLVHWEIPVIKNG